MAAFNEFFYEYFDEVYQNIIDNRLTGPMGNNE
jgi:hypothetical protein